MRQNKLSCQINSSVEFFTKPLSGHSLVFWARSTFFPICRQQVATTVEISLLSSWLTWWLFGTVHFKEWREHDSFGLVNACKSSCHYWCVTHCFGWGWVCGSVLAPLPNLPYPSTAACQSHSPCIWFNTNLSVNKFLSQPIKEALEKSGLLLIPHNSSFSLPAFRSSPLLLLWSPMPLLSSYMMLSFSTTLSSLLKWKREKSKARWWLWFQTEKKLSTDSLVSRPACLREVSVWCLLWIPVTLIVFCLKSRQGVCKGLMIKKCMLGKVTGRK